MPMTLAELLALLPDNTTGDISPADMRTVTTELFNQPSTPSAAWTTYTPVWTCGGTAPAIGNGTLTGAYRLDGKTLNLRIHFGAGSTTTFGTVDWKFSLPAGMTGKTVTGGGQVLTAWLNDNSAGIQIPGSCRVDTGGTTMSVVTWTSAPGGYATNTFPWTWAANDQIQITGTIEVD